SEARGRGIENAARGHTRPVKRYDTIVVGAGPAGSTTAYRLAREGASVLLLDRAVFPRDKPCGGGVTMRAAKQLPFSIDPVVEHVVTTAELRLGHRRTADRGRGGVLAYMTQRRRLDHLLAETAAAAGAEFRDGVKVTAVETDPAGAKVTVAGERVRADAVVGADGVNGATARALRLGGNRTVGVALEGNLGNEKLPPDRFRGRFLIDLGTIPGGYGWIFPKGDHVNVGVGGWESEGPRLREHLATLCEAHGIRVGDLDELRGFRLPCRAHDSTLAHGRGLVVGDAAGLVDPLTGDGMFEAFLSGRFAAEAVVKLLSGEEETLEPYGTRVTRHLAPLLWASWSLKAALDRFPRTTYAITKSRLVWPVVEKLVTGDLVDVRRAAGIARPPLKALALLARVAGDPGRAYRPTAAPAVRAD
ncbi:MAG: geranylgeranyl reductase family protein, partial [Actinomycetota bacterium]|nr:geranylgeranyl reductase family protein [Actinomycetota bacterium]